MHCEREFEAQVLGARAHTRSTAAVSALQDARQSIAFYGRRRLVLGLLLGPVGVSSFAQNSAPTFDDLLTELQTNEGLVDAMRRRSEDSSEAGLERAPLRAPKSKTPISDRATKLIVACEVSSKAVYEKRYQSPVWPKGKSGVTIGIGYDIGYVTPNQLAQDWKGYAKSEEIDALTDACGITGTGANDLIPMLRSPIQIDWDSAIKQFSEEIKPRYVGETERALAHSAKLNSDCLGALVSLVYNRGASFGEKGEHYKEMRNIRAHMVAENFSLIPPELRSMKRLWEGKPDMRGVVLRRDAEAALFELGLAAK